MFIKFTLEYSAGLIQTGQSLHAIKFLMSLDHDINNKNREKKQFEDISVKEQWLILIGKKKEKKKNIYIRSPIYNKRSLQLEIDISFIDCSKGTLTSTMETIPRRKNIIPRL